MKNASTGEPLCFKTWKLIEDLFPGETISWRDAAGSIMNSGAIADSISSLFQKLRLRQKEVSIAISGHSVIIKKINVPLMTKEELEEQIEEGEGRLEIDEAEFQRLTEELAGMRRRSIEIGFNNVQALPQGVLDGV